MGFSVLHLNSTDRVNFSFGTILQMVSWKLFKKGGDQSRTIRYHRAQSYPGHLWLSQTCNKAHLCHCQRPYHWHWASTTQCWSQRQMEEGMSPPGGKCSRWVEELLFMAAGGYGKGRGRHEPMPHFRLRSPTWRCSTHHQQNIWLDGEATLQSQQLSSE